VAQTINDRFESMIMPGGANRERPQTTPAEKLARHRAMSEMRQEAVIKLASVGRLKPTQMRHSGAGINRPDHFADRPRLGELEW